MSQPSRKTPRLSGIARRSLATLSDAVQLHMAGVLAIRRHQSAVVVSSVHIEPIRSVPDDKILVPIPMVHYPIYYSEANLSMVVLSAANFFATASGRYCGGIDSLVTLHITSYECQKMAASDFAGAGRQPVAVGASPTGVLSERPI
uniref:SFRICE_028964 n=1 Tax=Spodoptera frugiperda TaxID=7108 RepID=A0A2H1W984_SPOFR